MCIRDRQKPEATSVAGYTSWQRNFDRQVMKGEKGIKILAPAPVSYTHLDVYKRQHPALPHHDHQTRRNRTELRRIFEYVIKKEPLPTPKTGIDRGSWFVFRAFKQVPKSTLISALKKKLRREYNHLGWSICAALGLAITGFFDP